MSTITFFRQRRVDGAIRTGIDVEGETLLGRFENESDEPDPALEWYFDIEFVGDGIPLDVQNVKRWLIGQHEFVRTALLALVYDLRAGIDFGWPVRRELGNTENGVQVGFRGSTMRRISAEDFGSAISEIARSWADFVGSLQETQPA